MAPPTRRFCTRGHDTDIAGRGTSYHCRQCHREDQQRYENERLNNPVWRVTKYASNATQRRRKRLNKAREAREQAGLPPLDLPL